MSRALADGSVRFWYANDGWGVIDSNVTPGGCFAHCSALQVERNPVLESHQKVRFTWHRFRQDGYDFVADEVFPIVDEHH